jgi:capsule polysaccharide modification protein KpsS
MIPEIPQYYKSQGDTFEEQFNEDTLLAMEVMEINLTPGTTIFHKKANERPYIVEK